MHVRQDFHVHSTYSDGKGELSENITAALAAGIEELGCVDHVRQDTDWVPRYAHAVATLRATTPIQLYCGVEAKLLNEAGDIDVPRDLAGVDFIYVADHQLPWRDACLGPRDVRALLASGAATPQAIVTAITNATCRAMQRHPNVVVAHLFSILPKCGLTEDVVDDGSLDRIAAAAYRAGARVEFDERWNCPGRRVLQAMQSYSVPVVASSDAHRPSEIGRYAWLPTLLPQQDAA
ncbi:MAG TPA: PHP domain-containing protein [Kofleriaceae bacterium]|nr:PHP domain-containing protein [Kofleriaceae bacterium]